MVGKGEGSRTGGCEGREEAASGVSNSVILDEEERDALAGFASLHIRNPTGDWPRG